MRLNDDAKTVAAMDVLVPKVGGVHWGPEWCEERGWWQGARFRGKR